MKYHDEDEPEYDDGYNDDEDAEEDKQYKNYSYLDDEAHWLEEQEKAYQEARNGYIKSEQNQSNLQDCAVILCSLIGWTICFFNQKSYSGFLFSLAIACVLFSFQFSVKGFRFAVDSLDGFEDYDKNWYMKVVPWLNYASICFCIIGLISALFV